MGTDFANPENRPKQKRTEDRTPQTYTGSQDAPKLTPVKAVQKHTPPAERQKVLDELAQRVTDWRKPTRISDFTKPPVVTKLEIAANETSSVSEPRSGQGGTEQPEQYTKQKRSALEHQGQDPVELHYRKPGARRLTKLEAEQMCKEANWTQDAPHQSDDAWVEASHQGTAPLPQQSRITPGNESPAPTTVFPVKPQPIEVASTTLTSGILAQQSTQGTKSDTNTASTQNLQSDPKQLIAQAKPEYEGVWLNSGIISRGGLEQMAFDGRIVRTDQNGKQTIIPVKYGQTVQQQTGDQLQYYFGSGNGIKKQLTPQQQRDEAIKRMPYGDKLVDAAKMVPDLLKGDAKAAYHKMVSDPGFVAQLVAVSAVFTALQATPAGPLMDGALVAYLGFSAGFSLAGYLLKTSSAKGESGLKAAATDLKDLVEIVGVAALGAILGNAGKILRALQGTSKVAGQVLARNSLIVDENVFIARQHLAEGTANAYEKLQLQRLEQIGSDDLRATNSINARLTARNPAFANKGINLSTKRTSSEYQGLLKELETPVIVKGKLKSGPIGGKTGVDDRNIVADSFFAKTEPGVVPRFATADSKVYNSLAWRAGIKVDQLEGKTLSEAYPKGFNVTINGKTLHVFPLPKK